MEGTGKQPSRPTLIKKKKSVFGKKQKFQERKSFSFADFHDDAKMISDAWKAEQPNEEAADNMFQNMEPESFAAMFRKLQESVDDNYFGVFFRELMEKMNKMAPKFKAAGHEIFIMP